MAHHVFPEIVVDHVTSVTLDKFYPLLSASWFHHCVFLQPSHRSALVDLTVDQSSRGLVYRIIELLHQILHGVIFVCALGIDSGGRKQDFLLELHSVGLSRERNLPTEI